MHTRDEAGINKDKATQLLNQYSFQPPTTTLASEDIQGPETLSPDEVAEEFAMFEAQERERQTAEVQGNDEGTRGDGFGEAVDVSAVYAVGELVEIRKGVAPKPVQEEVGEHDNAPGNKNWSADELLRSVGLS